MPDLVTMDFKINGYNLKQSTAQFAREKYVSINTINVLSAVITGKDKLLVHEEGSDQLKTGRLKHFTRGSDS